MVTMKRRNTLLSICWLLFVSTAVEAATTTTTISSTTITITTTTTVRAAATSNTRSQDRDRRQLQGKENKNKGTPAPSIFPSPFPTSPPSANPSSAPTTSFPSASPTVAPTNQPSTPFPTRIRSASPSKSPRPSFSPQPTSSAVPSASPTGTPSKSPAPTTSVPSARPTFSPSSSPTGLPSSSPSQYPTLTPTTSFPSSTPTAAPTQSGINGIVNLRFSVLRDGLEALEFVLGREAELVDAVQQSINRILCEDTNLDVWINRDGNSFCTNTTDNARFLYERELQGGKQGALRDDLVVASLDDGKTPKVNFTEWRLTYPVMKIGEFYIDMAGESGGTALDMMESVAQLALDVRINAGDLDRWLADQKKSPRVSVIGKEEDTWIVVDPIPTEVTLQDQSISPPAFHGLRIAGIIMLIVSVGFWLLLMHLSGVRKKEREWDQEFRERGRGGLGTEEGLAYMLEVGRSRQATPEQEGTLNGTNGGSQDDDSPEDLRVPLPGYMNYQVT